MRDATHDRGDRGDGDDGRYRATEYGDDGTKWLLVQDMENDQAWLQSDAAVEVRR